jgi:hypothetical protein
MGDLLRSSMVIKEIVIDGHLGISALMSEWWILEISNHFLAFPYIHKFFPCTYTPRFAPAIRQYFKNAYYCIFVYWYWYMYYIWKISESSSIIFIFCNINFVTFNLCNIFGTAVIGLKLLRLPYHTW